VTRRLSFVHISDTHLGKTFEYTCRGSCSAQKLESVVESIHRLKEKPEFLIHTGDVCGDKESPAEAASYKLAESLFSQLKIPRFFVAGNHDDPELLQMHLQFGVRTVLVEDIKQLVYKFEFEGIQSLVLDASIPGKLSGFLPPIQLEILEQELRQASERQLIFLHYPPLELGAKWMDKEMLVTNRNALQEILLCYRTKIAAVFFGHIHHSQQFHKNGIFYVAAPSTVFQFSLASRSRPLDLDEEAPCGYNLVTLEEDLVNVRTIVMRTTFTNNQ